MVKNQSFVFAFLIASFANFVAATDTATTTTAPWSNSTVTGTAPSNSTTTTTSTDPLMTDVTYEFFTSPTSCYALPTPTASLKVLPRDDPGFTASVGSQLLSFADDNGTLAPLVAFNINGSEIVYDISNQDRLAFSTNTGSFVLEGNTVRLFAADCSSEIDISLGDLDAKIAAANVPATTVSVRRTRSLSNRNASLPTNTPFSVAITIVDECGVGRPNVGPSLALGSTPCDVDPAGDGQGGYTGLCSFPGLTIACASDFDAVLQWFSGPAAISDVLIKQAGITVLSTIIIRALTRMAAEAIPIAAAIRTYSFVGAAPLTRTFSTLTRAQSYIVDNKAEVVGTNCMEPPDALPLVLTVLNLQYPIQTITAPPALPISVFQAIPRSLSTVAGDLLTNGNFDNTDCSNNPSISPWTPFSNLPATATFSSGCQEGTNCISLFSDSEPASNCAATGVTKCPPYIAGVSQPLSHALTPGKAYSLSLAAQLISISGPLLSNPQAVCTLMAYLGRTFANPITVRKYDTTTTDAQFYDYIREVTVTNGAALGSQPDPLDLVTIRLECGGEVGVQAKLGLDSVSLVAV